jgi:hypothetical protein
MDQFAPNTNNRPEVPRPENLLGLVGQTLNMRRLRALQVAAKSTITYMGGVVFNVTSQSRGPGKIHKVELNENGDVQCGCEDWAKRRLTRCKHGEAVMKSLERFTSEEVEAWPVGYVLPPLTVEASVLLPLEQHIVKMYEGARRRPAITIAFPEGAKESTRRNQAYAAMQTRVPRLLSDLCRRYQQDAARKEGGQPLSHQDRLYSVLFRTFSNRSLSETCSNLDYYARNKRYVKKAPCKNSLCDYVHDPTLTPDLHNMLKRIASKVRDIETMVLVDSTGISSLFTQDWLDNNKGQKVIRDSNQWFKAHVAAGGVTGIPVAVIVSNHMRGADNGDEKELTADVNFWRPLTTTAKAVWSRLQFGLGDKAYLSEANIQHTADLGMRPIIPIKRNWNPTTKKSKAALELYELYTKDIAVFEEIYRYRGKIEGVFSAVKRVCGHYIWSRGTRWPYGPPTRKQFERARTAYENEILAKFIVLALRRLVTLEKLHDAEIDFSNSESLQPLPAEWYRTKGIDLDDLAMVDDIIDEEDEKGA